MNNLIWYRTISHMIQLSVLPEIRKRVDNGQIPKSDLPIDLQQFRVIQKKKDDDTIEPIVEINDEFKLITQVKLKRPVVKGQAMVLDDIYPEECYIPIPEYDGRKAGYFACQRRFLTHFMFFDFSPNTPNLESTESKMQYPILEMMNDFIFFEQTKPLDKIQNLVSKEWPPGTAYYPSVISTIAQNPSIVDTPQFVEIVSNSYSDSYWAQKIEFWKESKFFPKRLIYIEKAIERYLAGDYVSSIYTITPQFEGAMVDYIAECNLIPHPEFRKKVEQLKLLVISREAILFPKKLIDISFDFFKNGSLWSSTGNIQNPNTTINRHGIVHGVFSGFESKELALKNLISFDLLAFILLNDKAMTGNMW